MPAGWGAALGSMAHTEFALSHDCIYSPFSQNHQSHRVRWSRGGMGKEQHF